MRGVKDGGTAAQTSGAVAGQPAKRPHHRLAQTAPQVAIEVAHGEKDKAVQPQYRKRPCLACDQTAQQGQPQEADAKGSLLFAEQQGTNQQ